LTVFRKCSDLSEQKSNVCLFSSEVRIICKKLTHFGIVFDENYILDSGANVAVFNDKKFLEGAEKTPPKVNIHTINGKEFCGEFATLLVKQGVKHRKTSRFSPQQNGKVEIRNRYLMAATRCLLQDSGLPLDMWAHAHKHAAYIYNRFVRPSGRKKSAYFLLFGRDYQVKKLRRFGEEIFYKKQPVELNKLLPSNRPGYYLGNSLNSPAFISRRENW
jgi:hypothetical protein